MTKIETIKPLRMEGSLIVFLVPGFLFFILLHFIQPLLIELMVPQWIVNESCYVFMYTLAFAIAIYLLQRDGQEFTAKKVFKRMRFRHFSLKDLFWTIGLFIVFVTSFIIVNNTFKGFFTIPNYMISAPGTDHGLQLKGNYSYFIYSVIILIYGVIAEEVVWRGVILPKQELAFGKYAFIVNGLLWAIFHMSLWWIAPSFILSGIALAFVCQKTKSIWPGMIVHLIFNIIGSSDKWIEIFI